MPGLLDQGDDADTLNAQQLQALLGSGDPRAAQLFLGATTAQDAPASDSAASPPAAPSAPPDGAPSPAAAAPDDQPSFLDRFGGWVGKAGLALAGGDPALAGLSEAQSRSAGTRALLQFGLSMLANSGPSYTPRNFGQILAAGLESAGKVPLETEQLVATNQQRQSELALKRAGLQIQGLTAQARLEQLKLLRDQIAGGKKAADDAAGGGGSPAPSLTPGGSPASPGGSDADFVTKFAPIAQQVSQDTGLPADFITSQAALETGYGRSPAAQKNNFFGITGADGKPLAFDTPEAGVKAYTDLLKSDRYKGVTRSGDHKALGDALALAGYNSNVPAEGKADSYGTRIAAVGQRIAGLRAAGAPGRVQVAGPGAGTGGATTPPAPTPPGTTPPAITAPAAPAAPGLAAPPAANLPPALVKPPDLPPMVAPSIADLAPERARIEAEFRQQVQALQASPNKDTAQKVTELEAKRNEQRAALDKEARDRQVAFDDQRRKDAIDYQLKVASENRAAQQKQAEADAELQRQMKLKEQEAELKQRETKQGYIDQSDQKRLEALNAQADSARARQNDAEVLKPLAATMGPANFLSDTEWGKHLRDALLTAKIGTPEQLKSMGNQQLWDTLRNGMFAQVHVPGIGAQSDWEGRRLIDSWGSNAQNPLDRLTALSVIQKLGDQRVKDAIVAGKKIREPDGLKTFDEERKGDSVFDRPPKDALPTDGEAQRKYNASHAPGEPYYSWAQDSSGKWVQAWTRNKLRPRPGERGLEYLTPDVTVGAGG
jgi:hypothetical protein